MQRERCILKLYHQTNILALTCFKARSCFVDDVNAAFATNQLAVPMAAFKRFKRIFNFHNSHQYGWPLPGIVGMRARARFNR